MPSVAELLIQEAKENERRRILDIIRERETIEDAVAKIMAMLSNG